MTSMILGLQGLCYSNLCGMWVVRVLLMQYPRYYKYNNMSLLKGKVQYYSLDYGQILSYVSAFPGKKLESSLVYTVITFFYFQALHQLQALNGYTAASTTAAAAAQTAAGAPVHALHQATAAGQQQHQQQPQQPVNPYQGAGLTAATTATAQPAGMNILALQQLLAANSQLAGLTNGTTAAPGKNLALISSIVLGY